MECDMRWTVVVAVLAMFALLVPVMALAEAASSGAWCGGSYGPEGSNCASCVGVQREVQTAGQASGIQSQIVPTEPQYPAGEVTFATGQALFNRQPLSLNYRRARDRSHEVQSGGE